IAADLLEGAASLRPDRARCPGPPRAGRRPGRPAIGAPARGPRGVALGLARRDGGDGALEPPALWAPSDGPGRLALRARAEPPGTRRARNDGASPGRRHDRHALSVLAVPRGRAWRRTFLLGRGGAGGRELLVQVHGGALAAAAGAGLVARPLARPGSRPGRV